MKKSKNSFMLKFLMSLFLFVGLFVNNGFTQNPTIITDSLVVMNRVYAKEKLVVDQEAKFKQDIKVLGTARMQGDAIISLDLRVDGTAKLQGNVKMSGLDVETELTYNSEMLVVLPNGQVKKVTIGTIMSAPQGPAELEPCPPDNQAPHWWSGPNKIYVHCPTVDVGIGTNSPANKLHVVGLTYSSKGFLAGNSGANSEALLNAYAQSSSVNLLDLGVKIGGGSQEVRFTVTNDGEIFCKNLGSDPSLEIHNGDGPAIVVYSNAGGNKIFQLEDDGMLRSRRIKVDQEAWADFVLKPGYQLMTLKQTEEFITKNGHLPGIPSEKQVVDEGLDLGEMQKNQMAKIEEMYLHMIEMNKEIETLKTEIQNLKDENEKLKKN